MQRLATQETNLSSDPGPSLNESLTRVPAQGTGTYERPNPSCGVHCGLPFPPHSATLFPILLFYFESYFLIPFHLAIPMMYPLRAKKPTKHYTKSPLSVCSVKHGPG